MPGKKSYGRFQRFNTPRNPKKKPKQVVVVLVNPESSDVGGEPAPPLLCDLPSASGTRSDCLEAYVFL